MIHARHLPLGPRGHASGRRRLSLIVGLYLLRVVLAASFAVSAASFATQALSALGKGDALLFDDGGTYLIELVRTGHQALRGYAAQLLCTALLASYLGLIPLAFCMVALSRPKASFSALLPATFATFGSFSLLLGVTLLSSAFLATLAITGGALLRGPFQARLGDPGGDIAQASVWLLACLTASLLAVVQDAARASVVQRGDVAASALLAGFATLRRQAIRLIPGYFARSALVLAAMLLAARAAERWGVASGGALFRVGLMHQAVIVFWVAMRVSWLMQVLRASVSEVNASASDQESER